jgi:peroxiredoxin
VAAFVSVDEPRGLAKTASAYEVPFPLMSDPDLEVHEAYRVINAVDQAGYERLKKMGHDLEAWSERKHHKIAIPSIFLIGKDKKVKWAHAAHDYKTRPSMDDLVAALTKVVAAQ